jgi:hypothetical protein
MVDKRLGKELAVLKGAMGNAALMERGLFREWSAPAIPKSREIGREP